MRRLLIIALFFVLYACNHENKEQLSQVTDDFSSPRSLFVDHVSSFTAGAVSIASDIRLKLTKSVSDSITALPLKNVFNFSPSIEGVAEWENNRTIVFRPSTALISNQKYEVTADLGGIIHKIDSDKREFKFIFQTLVQNFQIDVRGLKLYNSTDLTRVKIEGQLQTADVATFEMIQDVLHVSQSGIALSLTWNATNQPNTYEFTVENVARNDEEGEVEFMVNGNSIGVDRKEEWEVEVPALNDYRITSSRVVRGEENYISVIFTDPLDVGQNLSGLVILANTNSLPRVVIDLNEMKIYPTQEINSNTELNISNGVKNVAGFKLKKDFSTSLQFTQKKPEVRLAGSEKKAILPNSNGLILPFEAVGLTAVEVTIIRIFEDNVLQYLQVNGMGDERQLSRVGRPVAKKNVPLNLSGVTDLNAWNRFSLNLEDILTVEPGAIYQIRIGFNKKHSLFFCGDNELIENTESDVDEWGPQEEGSYWDSYDYYYNPGYNWEERDNPCSDSYYGRRRSVSKILMASDFGIIAKKRDNGDLNVFVTNLVTADPIDNVIVEVYDYQQQLLTRSETDKNGKTKIALDNQPFVLIARQDQQIGYLKLDDGSALSLSNFDVTGNQIQKGIKGFIYGERGVWRPADTVHLSFIIEDIAETLPEQHPVIMELIDPMGKLAYRKVSSEPVGNIYRFDFVTNADAPTGNWLAKVKVGGATFSKRVKVETIKPNRLKINLTFDQDRFDANDRVITGDLNVRWLTGATANNLKAEYEVLLRRTKTTFPDYPNFNFDDQSKKFSSSRELVYEGKLNSDGFTKVQIDLGNTDEAPGALQAMLYGKVYEEGGNFSISNTSILYYPYSSFVGVRVPSGDKRGILLTDEDHQVGIATVDAEGNPISVDGLRVELFKLDWKWWWDKSYENISNYVGRSYREPLAKARINTKNGSGEWKLRLNYPDWGRYYVKVTDPISGHSSGQIVYMDWPGWAGKGKRGELDGATMLDFGVEKEVYNVGENVALSIPSTVGNRILVSLETGSEVLQTFWVEAKEGNTTISFEATPDMAPNVYAHLTMIQPHSQTANDLPIRLYGVKSIKVVDSSTKLEPIIKLPTELRPEQKYDIEVSEKSGKAMAYTLAIVDEGLLDITNYETPDPWSTFFAREALGVKTWDIYDDVMSAFSGKMDNLLAIGGDDALKAKEENETNRFKPVVIFLGPFFLEKGKTKTHNIRMPQYLGSVKTMVVAAAGRSYGSAHVQTPVKQPLMVMATLPRVAGPGETMKLPVNIFALDDKISDVTVTVEASGRLSTVGVKTTKVRFAKSGDKIVYFDLKSDQAIGVGKVKVTARAGNLESTYDINLQVIPRNPMYTAVEEKILSSEEQWEYKYVPVGIPGENGGYLEISTLPPLNIEQRMGYLVRYPHGCIEQTTSAVFSQLFLKNLITLNSEQQTEIQRNIEAGIKRLRAFQLSSGGFSYWPGNNYPNNWGSNYAGHFLIEAKDNGYIVPDGMLSSWITFQTSKAEAWGALSTNDNDALIQAYRLYTLAKAGSPSLGAMNRLKESNRLTRQAKWRLALAYVEAGYNQQAVNMVEGLAVSSDSVQNDYRYTFGSAVRDQAMIMETLLAIDRRETAFEILMDIAKKMGDKDRWMSTQTTAYAFIAIAKYAALYDVDSEASVSIDIDGKSSDIKRFGYVHQTHLNQPNKPATIRIDNSGGEPIFARVISQGIPIEGGEQSTKRNIDFIISYYDSQGQELDVSKLQQGTNFEARVTVMNPGLKGVYSDLSLTQIFPSGWEIINTRLDGSVGTPADAEYIEFRDDRVMHYFDLKPNERTTFTVLLNATYQGVFYLPAVSVGAMYDNSIFASQSGSWVTIIPERE